MERRLWELFDDLTHEELAAEQLWLHERAVLGHADLVGREVHPLCNSTDTLHLDVLIFFSSPIGITAVQVPLEGEVPSLERVVLEPSSRK